MKRNSKFLELLLEEVPSSTAEDEIEQVLDTHEGFTLEMLERLIASEIVSKDVACRIWGKSIGYAYVDPIVTIVTAEALEKVPLDIARKGRALGLYVVNNVMTVATADPDDAGLLKNLQNIAQIEISPVFSLPSEISDAIEIHYSTERSIIESIWDFEKKEGNLLTKLSQEDLASLSESESLIKVLDALLYFGIKQNASDIHIEPREKESRVRFRIDGRMQEVIQFSSTVHPAIVCRLKVITRVDVVESRFPQDGSFSITLGTNRADFRASFIPSTHGNNVVLRILPMSGKKEVISLDGMLVSQNVLRPLRRLIKSPNGIIFVTGPTGSGKTTTLYAALSEINSPEVKIATIEDPVEVHMEGIVQSQVNSYIDLTFAYIMRSILRQDPDVILVGEIRDLETAKTATEAALTGHLVLSTLHTNTAIQSIVRLVEIGIEPFLVAPSLIGVLGQRLAARICDHCKISYKPSQGVLNRYFHDSTEADVSFYRGSGCSYCRESGYRGRIAFHELVVVSEEMRNLIARNAGLKELKQAAEAVGYKSLRYDGLLKVLLGLTSIDEIEKHTSLEWSQ